MIPASQRYQTNAKAPVKQIQLKITGENNQIIATGDSDLIRAKIKQAGQFLGVATKKIEITAIGDKSSLANQNIKVELGIIDPATSQTDWTTQGFFFVQEVKVNLEKGTSEITAKDLALRLAETEYSTAQPFTFPTTVAGLAQQIATSQNITLADISTLPNANYQIKEDLYKKIKGFTIKNIIEEIAQATGTTAKIREKQLIFESITTPSIQTLTADNLKTFKLGEKWGKANSLILSRQPQNDDIAMRNEASTNKGTTEIKIINNEILDDNRRELIQPLFDRIIKPDNLELYNIEAKTEGHGFYEIGDKITLQAEGKTATGYITQIDLDINGALTEQITCETPQQTKTDYKAVGAIKRTIYNTEIKTDKQGQQIAAVVSKQESLERENFERYTQLTQNIENFKYQIGKAGGLNFIKNSAFFSEDQQTKKPNFWKIEGAGTLTAESSPEAKLNGAISARAIEIRNLKISQEITVAPNLTQTSEAETNYYALSFRLKKSAIGAFTARIYDGTTKVGEFSSPAGTTATWQEVKLEGIAPKTTTLLIELEQDNADNAEFADLMLANSKTATHWQLAQGEIANTQVVIDEKGILVKSSINEGDYTIISEQEFSGYSKNQQGQVVRAFTLNKGRTEVSELRADKNVYINPVKFVPIRTGDTQGLAIVASIEQEN